MNIQLFLLTSCLYLAVGYSPQPLFAATDGKPITLEIKNMGPDPLQWYVISESDKLKPNIPYEATIWGQTYVYWKDNQQQFHAIQNTCNHRGALLSKGTIDSVTNCVQCPYHGIEFYGNGSIAKIPSSIKTTATHITKGSKWNQPSFPVAEHAGWVYINTQPNADSATDQTAIPPFLEPETDMKPFSRVLCNFPAIPVNSRVLSENLLDILHITYVHSFGNEESPTPLNTPRPYFVNDEMRENSDNNNIEHVRYLDEYVQPVQTSDAVPSTINPTVKPQPISKKKRFLQSVVNILRKAFRLKHINIFPQPLLHPIKTAVETPTYDKIPKNEQYGIRYIFKTNTQSVIKKVFNYEHIIIETEFRLPHYTISRVCFGPYYKTVVAFSTPVRNKETNLFIKLYRNYWLSNVPVLGLAVEKVADYLMAFMLKETFKEDARILVDLMDHDTQMGKYNLKYDKFPLLFRQLYMKHFSPQPPSH